MQDQGSWPVSMILSSTWPTGTQCLICTKPRFLLEAHARNGSDQGNLQRLKDGFALKLSLEEWPGSLFVPKQEKG